MHRRILIAIAALLLSAAAVVAQEGETRLLRQPDIHGDTDRLRLRRRHLAGRCRGRRRPAPHLATRGGALPEVLARRPLDRLHRRVQRQPPGLRHQRRRRRAAAAHVLQRRRRAAAARRHRQPRPRLDAGRQEHPLPAAPPAVERPHGPPLHRPGRRRHGDAAARSRRAAAACTRRTARSSSTRRSSASSAPGSATAAAARRTSGSTTWRRTAPSSSPTSRAPTTSRSGSATRSTSPRDRERQRSS